MNAASPWAKKGDELRIEPTDRGRKTGTRTRWLPDLDVFTDIDIPADYYVETLRRQAVVNAGITFRFKNEVLPGHFETQDFVYENGIIDYVAEIAGEDALTTPRLLGDGAPRPRPRGQARIQGQALLRVLLFE